MPPNGSEVEGWAGPCLLPESLKPHLVMRYDTTRHDFYAAAQAALAWHGDLADLEHKSLMPAAATPPPLHRAQVQARLATPCASKEEAKQQRKMWLSNEGRRMLEHVYHRFVREVVLPHFGCDILYQAQPVWRCVLPGSVPPCAPHCDADYFHDPSEVNFWMPLTPVGGSNSLYCESEPGKGDFQSFELCFGELMRFYVRSRGPTSKPRLPSSCVRY